MRGLSILASLFISPCLWQGLNEIVCMPPLQSVFIVCSPGRAEPKLSRLRVSAAGLARGERERERAILHRYKVLLVPPLFSQLLLCCNTLLSFLYPLWWDGSLSFNSLIALSLLLSLSHLCLYGLTLQLNSVLFGWDGHTITGLVRRWGFLFLRGEERMFHALKSRWREQ